MSRNRLVWVRPPLRAQRTPGQARVPACFRLSRAVRHMGSRLLIWSLSGRSSDQDSDYKQILESLPFRGPVGRGSLSQTGLHGPTAHSARHGGPNSPEPENRQSRVSAPSHGCGVSGHSWSSVHVGGELIDEECQRVEANLGAPDEGIQGDVSVVCIWCPCVGSHCRQSVMEEST